MLSSNKLPETCWNRTDVNQGLVLVSNLFHSVPFPSLDYGNAWHTIHTHTHTQWTPDQVSKPIPSLARFGHNFWTIRQIFKLKKRSELDFLFNWLILISFFCQIQSYPSQTKLQLNLSGFGSAQLSLSVILIILHVTLVSNDNKQKEAHKNNLFDASPIACQVLRSIG